MLTGVGRSWALYWGLVTVTAGPLAALFCEKRLEAAFVLNVFNATGISVPHPQRSLLAPEYRINYILIIDPLTF